jgi:membrane protein
VNWKTPLRQFLNVPELWLTVRQAFQQWLDHEGARLAASLSLYSLLSLAPLVILAIAIASLVFDHSSAQAVLLTEIHALMGPEGANAVQSIIEHGKTPETDHIASVIGILTLLFGASSVFAELQSALNKIWDVETPQHGGLASLIKSRLFSFAMVVALGFLLLVSLVFSAALAALGKYFGGLLPAPEWALSALNFALSFVGISVLITLILKYIPDESIQWRDVLQGGIATAFLFTVGKFVLGLYLGKAAVGSAYGAAGSLIVVVLWVYYSAMIFYFGAEFTHVRASRRTQGSKLEVGAVAPVR